MSHHYHTRTRDETELIAARAQHVERTNMKPYRSERRYRHYIHYQFLVAFSQFILLQYHVFAQPSHQTAPSRFNTLIANSYTSLSKQTSPTATTSLSKSELTETSTSAKPSIPIISTTNSNSIDTIPNNTWIERILIRVESFDIQNHDQNIKSKSHLSPEPVTAIDFDEQTLQTASSSSSLAPTDSDDDESLDGSTTVAPDNSVTRTSNQSTATQYTIATDQDPIDEAREEEQRLVETNNVSAVINLENNQHRPENSIYYKPSSDKPQTSQIVQPPVEGPNTSSIITTTSSPALSCEKAYTQCALRKACAPALKRYNDDCNDLINGRRNNCSPECLRAMIALRSSEEGGDLVGCDCQGNEFCLESKQRSQMCRPQVEQAMNPETVVTCSTASSICLADQLCSTALDYYNRFCQSLFSHQVCSPRCNNSLSILYRQPKAAKLINCRCDGTEEFPCLRYRTYTERFCLNKPLSKFQIEIAADDDERYSSSRTDDYTINLTKETDLNMDGTPLRNDKDDYEEEAKGADDGDGDGTDDDGIEDGSQMSDENSMSSEDKWIPLISGRYFSNLYHRQDRSKQVLQHENSQHTHRDHGLDVTHRGRRREQYYGRDNRGGAHSQAPDERGHVGRHSKGRTHRTLTLGSRSSASQLVLCAQVQLFMAIMIALSVSTIYYYGI